MKKQLSLIMLGLLLVSMMAFLPNMANIAHGYTPADYKTSIIKAADRLVALQSPTDYGWDWVVTGLTSHTANPSATNLYGITALSLIDAYELTGNASYLTATENSGNFMKYGDPSAGDFYNGHGVYYWGFADDYIFLMRLSAVSGDVSYKNYALAAWAWQKANRAVYYGDGNQATLWGYYANHWIGTNMYGAAAFGTSDWGLATLEMGDTVWAGHMAGVIHTNMANILAANVETDYKDMGMGWTLKFLVTLDPVTYASDIASLKTALKADQLSDGSWDYGPPPPGDEQTTAYVVMGLWAAGEYTAARIGLDWLVTTQLTNGGWLSNEATPTEYSEPDSEGLMGVFTGTSYASALYISPSTVTRIPSAVGTNFTVAVTLSNFGNLMGFDINLTWDGSLISNGQVDKTPLNALWPGGWTQVFEQSGVGFYELAASSINTTASNAGASVLFNVTFQIVKSCNFQLSTPIHFALVKLSDNGTPIPNPIVPTTTDGLYTISGTKPDLQFAVLKQNKKTGVYEPVTLPDHFEYCNYFEVQVYVSHICVNSPLEDYDVRISFDHTLARFVDVDVWGVLGNGTVDYTLGSDVVHVSRTNPAGWSGDLGLLFTLTFHVEFAATPNHIWKYGNANNMTFNVTVTDATLSFGTHGTIGMSGITMPSALTFEVDFIRGDVDCNGVVNLADIGSVAYYYGGLASVKPEYDLNNDGIIDIYDIVTIATNYGYGLDP